MRTEADVHRIVIQQQAGTLQVLHRVEGDSSIDARFSAGPCHRRSQRHRAIESLRAGGQIERVQVEDRRAVLQHVRHHVQHSALRVYYARAQDADLITDVSTLAVQQHGGDRVPQVDLP